METSLEFKKITCEFGIASSAVAVLLAVVFCVLDMVANQAGSEVSTRRPVIIVASLLAVIMALVCLSASFTCKSLAEAYEKER